MKNPYNGSFRVTSGYGYRVDPFTGQSGAWHGGIDLVGEDKTVVSVCSGKVVQSRIVTDESNRTSEWGNYVAVQADSGEIVYYCHLATRLVSVGEAVGIEQKIGVEGSSGKVTGVHLHFEVRRGGVQINAAEYLGIPNTAGFEYAESCDSIPAAWSEEAVEWAVKNGILRGEKNGDLKLRSYGTREEIVTVLWRAKNVIINDLKGEQ